jgi:hypothetical protein
MRAALRAGLPILIMFPGVKNRRNRLSRKAVLCALALQKYEDSLCRGCGQSSLLSFEDYAEGEYERRTVFCHACYVLDADNSKPGKGERVYVQDLHDHPHIDMEVGPDG